MTAENRQMWAELDIDLKQHDTLLNALGAALMAGNP
jgi:hypothetical protein